MLAQGLGTALQYTSRTRSGTIVGIAYTWSAVSKRDTAARRLPGAPERAMDELFSLGQWIKRRRKACDLTQDELARRVGCSLETIRKIEADARRPSRQIAERLADPLGLAPDERLA